MSVLGYDCNVSNALLLLGIFAAIGYGHRIAAFIWRFIRPAKNLKKYGKWGVVTGATDGIGFAVAMEFAKRGLNVALVSRTQSKLDECAKKISQKYSKVKVSTIQADFSQSDSAMWTRLESEISKLDIAVLYNNVGASYPYAQYLHELSDELIERLYLLNVDATTKMTKMVLPGMIANKRGAIVNVSSAAGFLQCGNPMYAIYSGTKAYIDFFSRSLHLEYKDKGIDIQCQVPFYVTTKLAKLRRTGFATPNPARFAKSSVDSIGYEACVIPHWTHITQNFLYQNLIPAFIFKPLMMKGFRAIRKKALKKLESKKE